jgi:CRISPR-associated protein Cas1
MPTLYITEPGARLEKEYQRLLVTKDDEVLLRLPLVHVSEVVLVGSVGVTTQALLALLDAGCGFSIITAAGRLLGRLTPVESPNLPLRRRQYACAQDRAFALRLSRQIVAGKLRNQRAYLRRLSRARGKAFEAHIRTITASLKQSGLASDLDQLRGLEGLAAKAYFQALRQVVPPGWESPRRTRRPPGDAFNALLSLGYTLLTQNAVTALEIAGLDPYEGFFHADKSGRPALALDLVEEFRTIVVDSVVLSVINKKVLRPDDFQIGREGGVYLKPHALRRFLEQYTARLQTGVIHPAAGRRLTYQKCLEVQARLLRKVISAETEDYPPFLTR